MPDSSDHLQHLPLPPIDDHDRVEGFSPPSRSPLGGPRFPPRTDKNQHGSRLKQEMQAIWREFDEAFPSLEQWRSQLAAFGLVLEISGMAGYALATDSLESRNLGIHLLSEHKTVDADGSPCTTAVVFVPHDSLAEFLERIDAYMAPPSEGERHKREDLFSSIEQIRRATVTALWNDPMDLLPAPDQLTWWEVWVRRGDPRAGYDTDPIFSQVRNACEESGIVCSSEVLVLPEQLVVLVKATLAQIGQSVPILSALHRLRRPPVHAGFFMSNRSDQKQWTNTLLERILWPAEDAPAVTLLDTGVNRSHPLLELALATSDCDAYQLEAWGVDDRNGHGTQMAGLALYGDLTDVLPKSGQESLLHRLESVKLIPHSGPTNDPSHYARITQECMSRPYTWLNTPARKRVFCLTVCSSDGLDRGRPSAWSAGLDAAILNGAQSQSDAPNLVCISAGNLDRGKVPRYPNSNEESSCHNPAQSWNAITVGAYTEKNLSYDQEFLGWKPVATPGTLGPTSTTGLGWDKHWPIKPDVVMEGGNFIRSANDPSVVDTPDDTQLLTTHHRPFEKLFAATGDTSAAAALAARYCAIIMANHPERWPETIRALLVHSARWTPQMTGWKPRNEWKLPSKWSKGHSLGLLQRYGFGVPDLNRALWSARSSVTLIAEEVIQPYWKERVEGKRPSSKAKGYHRHRIPIPTIILGEHFDKRVRLRVTLSYFIDPNPTNPEVSSKYAYQGAGLRFQMKSKSETDEQFFARINQLEKEGIDEKGDNDSNQWFLGNDHRSRGSVHTDIWYGTAAELVNKDCIAVFPVGGWWKSRPFLGKLENKLRYALLVSVEIEDATIDLYTPISTLVTQPVTV